MASGEYKYRVSLPPQVERQTTPTEFKPKKRGKLKYCKKSPDGEHVYKHNSKRDNRVCNIGNGWVFLACQFCGSSETLFAPNERNGIWRKGAWSHSDRVIIGKCEDKLKQTLIDYESRKQQEV